MSFGTTLYTLRKNRNLSQEALAAELDTTRQAISKWENDQGFPEMDKLMMLSSFFGVTVDYLLKGEDTETTSSDNEGGYYASRENIEGFLSYEHRTVSSIAFGVFLILMSAAPFFLFAVDSVLSISIAVILVCAGAGFIVAACFKENRYKRIVNEPLLIDNKYLTELRDQYTPNKKKYTGLLIGGIGLGGASLALTTILEDVLHIGESGYHIIPLLFFAAGAYAIIYSSVMMWAYKVVTNNSEHIKQRGPSKKPVSLWNVIGIIAVCIAALSFLYIVTGGSGHIAEWIDKILSKL